MRHNITEATRIIRDHKNRNKTTEAKQRQFERDTLTDQEQLKELDNRLGIGIGAARERKRLMS